MNIKKRLNKISIFIISLISLITLFFIFPISPKPPKEPKFKKQLIGPWEYTGEVRAAGMDISLGKNTGELFPQITEEAPTKTEAGRIKISRNQTEIEFLIPIEGVKVKKENNKVVYTDKQKTIQAKYQLIDTGIKEEIVINDKRSLAFNNNTNSFMSQIKLKNLDLKISAGGVPVFYSKEGEYQFHFEEPFAYDAGGSRTNAVNYVIHPAEQSEAEGKPSEVGELSGIKQLLQPQSPQIPLNSLNTQNYIIEVIVDKNWLNSEERKYPITIDPTVVHDAQSDFSGQKNRILDVGTGETAPELVDYYQEIAPDEHTVGLWHMNEGSDNTCDGGEDVCDASGNGNDGTFNGTAAFTSSAKLGDYAVTFDGDSDYVNVGNDSSLQIKGELSIEGWFKTNSATDQRIVSKDDGTNRNYALWIDSGGDLGFGIWRSNTLYRTDSTESSNYADGNWHHVVGTIDSQSMHIYLDGKLLDTNSDGGTIDNDTVNLDIGRRSDGAQYFDGQIDEVAIYNRALTPEEIKSHASRRPYAVYTSDVIDLTEVTSWNDLSWTEEGVNTGDGETVYDGTDLVAQWNFNENSGTTANNDAEGSSCGGTPSNCDGTLLNFGSCDDGQDVCVNSGWTADNGRWPKSAPEAITFDGTDEVRIADDSSLEFGSNPFTIEAWVWVPDATPSNQMTIISKYKGASKSYWFQITTEGELYLLTNNGSSSVASLTNNKVIEAGKWQFVSVVKDGSDATFYVNGKLKSDTDGTHSTVRNASTYHYIGSREIWDGTRDDYFIGTIDSLRVYNGRALSADEILSNYQAGNIEFQTRVGSDNSPDDGDWEAWKPTSSESQILNMDSDSSNWSWD